MISKLIGFVKLIKPINFELSILILINYNQIQAEKISALHFQDLRVKDLAELLVSI